MIALRLPGAHGRCDPGEHRAVLRNVWAPALAHSGRRRAGFSSRPRGISITTITATSPKSISTTRSGISNTARPAATGSPAFRSGFSRRCRNCAATTCPVRAGNRSALSSSRDGPAGRHIEAAHAGVRPHRAELRRLSRRDHRETPQSTPVVVAGMPANHIDLGRFAQFLTDCALDERFNPWQVVQAAEQPAKLFAARPAAAAIHGRAGDARSADPGALQVPLPGP